MNEEPNEQPEMSDDDSVRLMSLLRDGDQNALRMLIARWQGPVINFFFRSLRDLQTAEDLSQIVFIRVYRNAANYQPQARFSTYIFHIARNILINEYRRQKRKPAELFDPTSFFQEVAHDDTSTKRIAEIEEAFARAIETLPENHRTALLLHKQQELSYEEIAKTMDATVPLVKTWIFRARQRLRELLSEFAP